MNGMRKTGMVTVLAVGIGSSLLMPFGAQASESGKRNTTYALGALTAVLGAKKQWVPAAIAGVGAVIAEQNWQKDINARHRRRGYGNDNYRYNNSGYNNDSYNNGYNSGYGAGSIPNIVIVPGDNGNRGYDRAGYDRAGYDRDGYDHDGYGRDGYDRDGYNHAGYDRTGYDRDGNDRSGYRNPGYVDQGHRRGDRYSTENGSRRDDNRHDGQYSAANGSRRDGNWRHDTVNNGNDSDNADRQNDANHQYDHGRRGGSWDGDRH